LVDSRKLRIIGWRLSQNGKDFRLVPLPMTAIDPGAERCQGQTAEVQLANPGDALASARKNSSLEELVNWRF
jgi:hypothetical protein